MNVRAVCRFEGLVQSDSIGAICTLVGSDQSHSIGAVCRLLETNQPDIVDSGHTLAVLNVDGGSDRLCNKGTSSQTVETPAWASHALYLESGG